MNRVAALAAAVALSLDPRLVSSAACLICSWQAPLAAPHLCWAQKCSEVGGRALVQARKRHAWSGQKRVVAGWLGGGTGRRTSQGVLRIVRPLQRGW